MKNKRKTKIAKNTKYPTIVARLEYVTGQSLQMRFTKVSFLRLVFYHTGKQKDTFFFCILYGDEESDRNGDFLAVCGN